MEKGKWFKLTGVQINKVKISGKALQGELQLYYFELAGTSNY